MAERVKVQILAKGRWREILPAIGISSKFLANRHGPCPVCGGKDRFRFDDKDGRGTFYCTHCEPGDGVALVMKFKDWDFRTAAFEIEKIIGSGAIPLADISQAIDDTAEKYAQAVGFWREGHRIEAGDPVDRYLKRRVGRYAPTRALRTITATSFAGRKLPAMVAAYVDVHGDLAGIQRTFLTIDGKKAPDLGADRWNTGKLPDGGAIRLAPHEHRLGIAEGVETALAASVMFNMPVWATLSENRLEVWQPPEGVTEIVIFADNDENSAGQAAAFNLSKRLNFDAKRHGKPLIVQVTIPPEVGTDWNDVLLQREPA